LTGIRGLSQRVNGKLIPEIGEVVEAALNLPDSQLPAKVESGTSASIGILGQFLTTSLNLVCHELRVSPALVATSQEIRNLAAWQMGQSNEEAAPGLLRGWRRHVLTNLFDDVIHGRLVLRVTDPTSPNPVRLERWPPVAESAD
jgi:ribonuclease D